MSEPSTKSALESVLSESGAMPTARMGIRLQAFFFDWIFVSLLASIVIWKFAMPQKFPDAYDNLNIWFQDLVHWFGTDGFQKGTPMPQWNEALTDAMTFAQLLTLSAFWLYFTIGDAFFSGCTFGKSICRLRTISIVTMEKPFFLTAIMRGGLKAFALLYPILMVATMIALKFNRQRQMGHDILCKTAVVDERYLSSVN